MTTFRLQTAAQQPAFPSIPSFETLASHLLAYDFPAGFAERLAGEEGWTLAFALDVLNEYRRFLVLAATAGQSVTPSRAVDAAWHLHLMHTRDYWLRLTPLLPAALHHDPSGGSISEAASFARQYLETLALYRARFGEAPPLIWPGPSTTAPRRIGWAKRRFPRWLALLTLWVVGGAALMRFGIWAVAGLVVLGFVLLAARPGAKKRRGSGEGGAGDGNGTGLFSIPSDFSFGNLGGDTCDASGSEGGSNDGSCSDGAGSDGGGGSSCGSGCAR
ncbi:hypothetical protein GCM10022631_28240 [Deinococcus rubellus]|uniref:TIGR04222 domain-containing membrane protein n=1 Tax=Deinococcus rubellus TaxID=1889240 RepID=A0ABY5YLI2_9DEIO|nr:hypothetical protein [Deinococcus rubellus]UWX64962.1 hypothetical protein N0D28_04705 [Deinococcus rubellus]